MALIDIDTIILFRDREGERDPLKAIWYLVAVRIERVLDLNLTNCSSDCCSYWSWGWTEHSLTIPCRYDRPAS